MLSIDDINLFLVGYFVAVGGWNDRFVVDKEVFMTVEEIHLEAVRLGKKMASSRTGTGWDSSAR
jgi:hypothetical protein